VTKERVGKSKKGIFEIKKKKLAISQEKKKVKSR